MGAGSSKTLLSGKAQQAAELLSQIQQLAETYPQIMEEFDDESYNYPKESGITGHSISIDRELFTRTLKKISTAMSKERV